jgi:hypothetical protein
LIRNFKNLSENSFKSHYTHFQTSFYRRETEKQPFEAYFLPKKAAMNPLKIKPFFCPNPVITDFQKINKAQHLLLIWFSIRGWKNEKTLSFC